jgi:parvulin-like peptidyl-prolyl isomerase
MAKQSETRQSAAKQAAAPTLTKKQIARSRKETRQLRIIWSVVAALGVVILAVLVFALIRELVVVPNKAVAVVDGTKVSVNDYEDLLTYRRYSLHNAIASLEYQLTLLDTSTEEGQFLSSYYGQQVEQYQAYLGYASDSALDEMIEDALIQKKAKEAGLSVTLDEARESIRADVESSLASQASSITTTETISEPTPVPTSIPAATIDETLQTYLTNMGLSASSFERLVQRSLLRTKVSDLLASQVVSTGLMIHVQLIVTDTQEVADTTKQRIEAGEDFATVAKEVSGESQVQENGGDLGWLAVDQLTSSYGADLANAATSQEIGTLAVVESNSQFYVLRVVERNENGTLPDSVISSRKSSALTDWLAAQTEALGDKIQRLLQSSQIPPDPFATASP